MEQLPWDNRTAIVHYGKFVVPWWAMCCALLLQDWKVVPSKRSNTYYQYTSIGHPPLSVPKRKKRHIYWWYVLLLSEGTIFQSWSNRAQHIAHHGTTNWPLWKIVHSLHWDNYLLCQFSNFFPLWSCSWSLPWPLPKKHAPSKSITNLELFYFGSWRFIKCKM